MKTEWLHRNNHKWLIIFYTGWGMDSNPFSILSTNEYDVLICYDYSDELCQIDIPGLSKIYDKIYFIGWSMGVVHGQRDFKDVVDYFDKIVAVNGTLRPIDDLYGIPVDICRSTLDVLNEETLVKFYRRMCRSSTILKKFIDSRPNRSLEDIKNELAVIFENQWKTKITDSIYTDIVISDKDLIIPTANQLCFWETAGAVNIKHLKSSHFPFYLWNSWDEMVEYMS